MAIKDIIPSKEEELESWGRLIVAKIESLGYKWNIPGITLAGLDTAIDPASSFAHLRTSFSNFRVKFIAASDPDTRTNPIVAAKNQFKRIFIGEMRAFAKEHLTYNSLISDEERVNLGLPIHKIGRSSAKEIDIIPWIDLNVTNGHRVIVNFHETNTKSNARPYGMSGAVIVYAILDAPAVMSDLSESVLATRNPHTFVFSANDSGKTVYMAICWQNKRGQKGPFSNIFSVVIP